MTATAFIIGVLLLVFASGAGAGACQSIGTTVFGGMVLVSFVGIVFVPMLFACFELLGSWRPVLLAKRHKQV
jgi:multidrug efflux pump subunit AcrB